MCCARPINHIVSVRLTRDQYSASTHTHTQPIKYKSWIHLEIIIPSPHVSHSCVTWRKFSGINIFAEFLDKWTTIIFKQTFCSYIRGIWPSGYMSINVLNIKRGSYKINSARSDLRFLFSLLIFLTNHKCSGPQASSDWLLKDRVSLELCLDSCTWFTFSIKYIAHTI